MLNVSGDVQEKNYYFDQMMLKSLKLQGNGNCY